MDVPPRGTNLRLRDFEEFLVGKHLAAVFVMDHDLPPPTAQVSAAVGKMDRPVALNGIAVAGAGNVTIWPDNVRVLDPVAITNSATNQEIVQFYLSSPVPPAPTIQFTVTGTFEPSSKPRLALEWLHSEELGRKLVDSKSGVLFPRLRPFWERVGSMSIDNATLFLQERIESTTRGTLTFFGVSVDRVLVLWVGPAVLFSLMLYFWLHLRHVNSVSVREIHAESSNGYPWVVCFPDSISEIVSYCSIIAFPIAASVLLLIEHGAWHEWSTRGGAALSFLVVVFGVLASREIHTFRAIQRKEISPACSEVGQH